ncbi:Thioredoxin-like superfamily [Sesbania bispinosa]|nr:Thioredoxin-like superfamily [Sesbania bispinosa]
MKGMKSRFHRKLKLIPTISNLKQGLVLQLNPSDVFCIQKCSNPPIYSDQYHKGNNLAGLEVCLNASEDDQHSEERELELEVIPTTGSKEKEPSEENLVASSPNLSETNMLKSMQQVPGSKVYPSLTDFEEIYPPGGSQAVILYTTSLRGIRKTFQDCNTIRFLLRSFKIIYHERDASLHLEYREELWKILGGKVIPPKLFIKGRYIGGVDEVVGLHEMGWLGKLLDGIPIDLADGPCKGCSCIRFAICSNCNGSCKVFSSNGVNKDELFIRCPECNENGLVKCPICC